MHNHNHTEIRYIFTVYKLDSFVYFSLAKACQKVCFFTNMCSLKESTHEIHNYRKPLTKFTTWSTVQLLLQLQQYKKLQLLQQNYSSLKISNLKLNFMHYLQKIHV